MTSEKRRLYEQALMAAQELAKRKNLSDAEKVDLAKRVERIEKMREELKNDELINATFAESFRPTSNPSTAGVKAGTPFAYIKAAGPDAARRGGVTIPFEAFGAKSDLIATQGDANPERRDEKVVEIGRDRRHIFPHLPTFGLSLDPVTTRVDYLKQTTRTLADTDQMQLALDASTTKPTTDTVAALASKEPIWVATISNPQPNALFSQPALQGLLNRDMAHAYRNSVDDYILEEFAAVASPLTYSQGTDTVLDAIYKAVAQALDNGHVPNLMVIRPSDFNPIALLKDANDRYYGIEKLAEWGLDVVISAQKAVGTVYLIDTDYVEFHASPVRYEVDSSLYFESNRTVARYEGIVAPVVTQDDALTTLTLA
jgi:hypothetical protein